MLDLLESVSVTPILDSGVLPPPRPKKRLLGVVVGFPIGILFAVAVNNFGGPESQPHLAFLFYFATLALAVTIHELGHLTAGWLMDFNSAAFL